MFYMHLWASSLIWACRSVRLRLESNLGIANNTASVTYIDRKGRRVSTEAAYLTHAVLARPNLTVTTGANVTRILFENKRAVGVEFAKEKDGHRFIARAAHEVVLACELSLHPWFFSLIFV